MPKYTCHECGRSFIEERKVLPKEFPHGRTGLVCPYCKEPINVFIDDNKAFEQPSE